MRIQKPLTKKQVAEIDKIRNEEEAATVVTPSGNAAGDGLLDPLDGRIVGKRRDKQKCRRCNGDGIMNWEHHGHWDRTVCTSCHGTGESADSSIGVLSDGGEKAKPKE